MLFDYLLIFFLRSNVDDNLSNSTQYFNLLFEIFKNGITASTYSNTVELILNYSSQNIKPCNIMEHIAGNCDDTIINTLFTDFPTAFSLQL